MSGFELLPSHNITLLSHGLYRLRYSCWLVRWYALISDIEIRFHSLCFVGWKEERGGGDPWVSHSMRFECDIYPTIESKAAENFIQPNIESTMLMIDIHQAAI